MEIIAALAPVAFVFALAANAQVSALKKDVEVLKEEVEELKKWH